MRRAKSYAALYTYPLGANGYPTAASESANINDLGSVNGLFFDQDRVSVVHGRMANPKKADEIMMSVRAAQELGLRVGETVPWGFAADSDISSPPKARYRLNLTLVGTVVLNSAVVQDEVDADGAQPVIFTPALTARMIPCCTDFTFTFLQLDGGSIHVPTVEDEIERIVPPILPYDFYDTSNDLTKAQIAIKPVTIALAIFGGIAALAALLIAMQLISRQMSVDDRDEDVMRSIGASPRMIVGDGTLGIIGSVVLGAIALDPPRAGSSLLSLPGRRLRLDRARYRSGRARGDSGCLHGYPRHSIGPSSRARVADRRREHRELPIPLQRSASPHPRWSGSDSPLRLVLPAPPPFVRPFWVPRSRRSL